jgi:hypothetical protein
MFWLITTVLGWLTAAALIAGSVYWALVPGLFLIWVLRERVSADERGVTVVNLVRRFRIPWSEIAGFERGRVGLTSCLDVCKRDGKRVHIWVTVSGWRGDYFEGEVDGIAMKLRRLRAAAVGRAELDASQRCALDEAVAAAQAGDLGPMDQILVSKRMDPDVLYARLHELADAGQLDLDALRAKRRYGDE